MSECECFPVADPWKYNGIPEPGGATEPNPDCPTQGATDAATNSGPPLTWEERAQKAQDAIGWADSSDPGAVAYAVLDLARFVTAMARELDKLTAAAPQLSDETPPSVRDIVTAEVESGALEHGDTVEVRVCHVPSRSPRWRCHRHHALQYRTVADDAGMCWGPVVGVVAAGVCAVGVHPMTDHRPLTPTPRRN